MTRPPASLIGVCVLLVAGVALGEATLPSSTAPTTTSAVTRPVTDANRVCPFLEGEAGTFGARVSLAAPGVTDTGPAGESSTLEQVVVAAAPPEAAPGPQPSADPSAAPSASPSALPTASPEPSPSGTAAPALPGPGTAVADLQVPAGTAVLSLAATGPVSGGLEATQVLRGVDGANRGLGLLRCPEPTTSAWFLGASSSVGADAVLRLVNDEDVDAVVDIDFLTADGRRAPSAGRGLSVPARTYLDVAVDDLAPDVDWLAVHLETRSGRVAAAVRQNRGAADEPLGVDFVPDAGSPSRSVVVPGVPAGGSGYALLLANPTDSEALVSVQSVTAEGQFVPEGLDSVPVPAESVVAVDVSGALSETPSTLRVRSDGGEVLAAVAIDQGSALSPLREIAYVGAGEPLGRSSVVTEVTSDGPATTHSLLLTALDADASVTITPLPVPGRDEPLPAPRVVAVPTGTTVELSLTSVAGGLAALPVELTVDLAGGEVVASSVHAERGGRGVLLSVLSVRSAPASVRLPVVEQVPGVSHPR